jgi:hypothetical protein
MPELQLQIGCKTLLGFAGCPQFVRVFCMPSRLPEECLVRTKLLPKTQSEHSLQRLSIPRNNVNIRATASMLAATAATSTVNKSESSLLQVHDEPGGLGL